MSFILAARISEPLKESEEASHREAFEMTKGVSKKVGFSSFEEMPHSCTTE